MCSDAGNDSATPERISRFEVLEKLGSGAMGIVYRAHDTLLKRDVALKLIRSDLAEQQRIRSRFIREVQAAATINHPGVATIYEAGETEDGRLFFASELIRGETLKDRIARGPVPPAEVIALGIQLADALAAAHAKGAIHRDIKPGNVMVTDDGRVKVLDFGLARLVMGSGSDSGDDQQTLTQTRDGVVVGTPAYMSPEQASGMRVDERTDIFAAGCVLYEMLSGRSPFQSDSVPETMRRILCEDPPPIESSSTAVPARLEQTLRKALAKSRDDRYSRASEMAADLRDTDPSETVVHRSGIAQVVPRTRKARTVFGLVTAAVVIAGSLVLWLGNRPGLAFASKDRLLIADVENLTGDDVFDLALHTALEAALQQSPYIAIADRAQTMETLRLMRREPTTPIDETVGRDICRFAGVRALLLPRIFAAGEAFELQAILVDPVTGRHVEGIRVTTEGREEVLLHAIDRLCREVRSRLGETLGSIEAANVPVSNVTTSSWEALQYFAKSNEAWAAGDWRNASALLEMALEKDPKFATAKGSLGLLFIQVLGEEERGKQLLAEALADGEGLPQREYLMLRATNRYFVDGDLEAALAEYELICEIFPEEAAAYNNRGRILKTLGRFEDAAELFDMAAELHPASATVPLINLAFLGINQLRDPARAENACRKLVALAPDTANYHSVLGWAIVIQGRFEEGLSELWTTVKLEPRHRFGLPNLAMLLYATGRAEESVSSYREMLSMVSEGQAPWIRWTTVRDLALALAAAGRTNEASELALREAELVRATNADTQPSAENLLDLAQLYAVAARPGDAANLVEEARRYPIEDASAWISLAQALALTGHDEEAIDAVRRSLDSGFPDPYLPMIMPSLHPLLDHPEFLELFDVEEIR